MPSAEATERDGAEGQRACRWSEGNLPPSRFKANEGMRELLGNEEGRTRTACIGMDQAGDMGMVSPS